MRILIVGGGIGGLAMARAGALCGLDGEVVERATTPQIAGAGIYLPGNGMAALGRLGLAEAVADRGAVVARRRLFDDRGRQLIDFDEAGLWRDVAPPIALHRETLQRILADDASHAPIRFGVAVTSIDDGPEAVRVAFDDGSSGTYDLVVGADGVHSDTRRTVLGGPEARLAGQVGWRFVVDGYAGIDGWNAWLGRDRGFLALGIGGDRVYGVGDIRSADGADPTGGDLETFKRLFEGYPEPVPSLLGRLRSSDELWFSPFEEVAPPAWVKGRVVLIGDAAHATAPNMAEGASLAVEDALVLADCLSSGGDVSQALAAYVQRRATRVAHVQRMTRRRDRLRYLHPALRRAVMGVAGPRDISRPLPAVARTAIASPILSPALRERGQPRVAIERARTRSGTGGRIAADRPIATEAGLEHPLPHRQARELVLEAADAVDGHDRADRGDAVRGELAADAAAEAADGRHHTGRGRRGHLEGEVCHRLAHPRSGVVERRHQHQLGQPSVVGRRRGR